MQHTLYSPLMRKFLRVRAQNSRDIIRFCKAYETRIDSLSGAEYFEIWTVFADALYDMEDWGYLGGVADEVLQYSMNENIKFYKGEDIYVKTLFYKTVTEYNLHNTEKATLFCVQLLRLQPQSVVYRKLLAKCFMRTRPRFVSYGYNIALLLYFAAAITATIKFFYIEPFAAYYDTVFLTLQVILFFCSAASVASVWVLHRMWAARKVKQTA
jgi:hypothetical protein